MKLFQKHKDFEMLCQQLVGLNISKAEYSEINYKPDKPEPNYLTNYSNIHSVDYSIFLHTQNHSFVEIFWSGEFFQFGIGIKINEKSNFSETMLWDVSELDIWKNIIGQIISKIEIECEELSTKDESNKIIENFVYPQNIKITFSNFNKIFISAAGFISQDDEQVFGMLDNLIVTDNEELAKKLNIIK